MRLTKEQALQYLLGDHKCCPACGSNGISYGSLDYEGYQISQTVNCYDCKTAWIDCYGLSHCVDMESGEVVAELIPRVLITVRAGVADFVADPGVDVEVLDWDNHQAGNPAHVPGSHLQLLAQSDPEAAAILKPEGEVHDQNP